LHPAIEIEEMRIDVVEQCALRLEAEGDRETAARRFNEPPVTLALPIFSQIGNLPTLTAGPFKWRWKNFAISRGNRIVFC